MLRTAGRRPSKPYWVTICRLSAWQISRRSQKTIARLKTGDVTVLREHSKDDDVPVTANTLAEKASGAPAEVTKILSGVKIAESLTHALGIRESLRAGESVVTTDGVWLGKDWLRVSRDKEGKAGILAREHEMRRLKSDMREMQVRHDSAKKLLHDGRTRLTQLEERRESMQADASALLNEYSEVKAALESARYKMDQANARKAALAEESSDLDSEKIAAEEQLRESQRVRNQAAELLQTLETEKQDQEARREELRSELAARSCTSR